MRTPRDTLHLNQENGMQLVAQTPRDVRLRENAKKSDLRSKLSALPKPKETSWEFELPEEREDDMEVEISEEDAAEIDRRKQAMQEAAERAEFARQTQVVQKSLPRPSIVDVEAMLKRVLDISDPIKREVEAEVALLIANDIKRFGGGKVSGTVKALESLSDEVLRTARMELALELSMNSGEDTKKFHEEFGTAWTNLHGSSTLPGLDGYEDDEIDEHQMMVEAFNSAQDKIIETAQQANKIEKKLTTHHGGYTKRSALLRQKIVDASAALDKANMDLDSTRTMQYSEESAVGRRLEGLRGEVSFVSKRERETQELYRTRKDELDSLQDPVNGVS